MVRVGLGEGVSENSKVRLWALAALVFFGLVAAIGSYVATNEFLTLTFVAFFVGNLVPPAIILVLVLLFPQSLIAILRSRRQRPEQRWNRAGVLVVAGLVLGVVLVLASAYAEL